MEKRIEEIERKTEGLAKSLDRVKDDVDILKKETSRIEGIALSADRGYHDLSARVQEIKSSFNKFINDQKETNKDIIKEITGIRKQAFKNTLILMGYIFVLLGTMFMVFVYIFEHLG